MKTTKEKIIEGAIAQILRDYIAYEYIDFISRSKSAKGTIDWSNYVARFLLKQFGKELEIFKLSQQKQEMIEEIELCPETPKGLGYLLPHLLAAGHCFWCGKELKRRLTK